MATSGYSEDLQPQQTNTVTIATPPATTPSAAKTAHFLSEIPLTSGTIASANQSAIASKTGQDALCSQVPPTQAQSHKAAVLTTPTQHYVTSEIQPSAVQKSNGQSSSPQYIIVTVTGERLRSDWHVLNQILCTTPSHKHQQDTTGFVPPALSGFWLFTNHMCALVFHLVLYIEMLFFSTVFKYRGELCVKL